MDFETGTEMSDFFRFPRTPHLAWLGNSEPRDDKLLSPVEAAALLGRAVVVEEKLDGANLGISLGADGRLHAQNRGQYLREPYSGQFTRLDAWRAAHEGALARALGEHLIAFGEWCAARHSLDYGALPDWLLLFDIYDRRERRFWSTSRRNAWAHALGLAVVPMLFRGRIDLSGLRTLLESAPSRFRSGPMEGVVVRVEDESWLFERAKLVRADFTQQIDTHWRRRALQWNRRAYPS